jgi:hypothetical protein
MIHAFRIAILVILPALISPQCYQNYQYSDAASGMCLPCEYNCLNCYDANYCLQCVSEYYLN